MSIFAACFAPSAPKDGRTDLALASAGQFLTQLKRAEKDLKKLERTAGTTLDGNRAVLDAALPSMPEAGVPPGQTIGGVGHSYELAQLRAEMGQKLQVLVFAPLATWAANYSDACARQKVVHKAYSDMESARHKAEAARGKLEATQAKAGDPKADAKLPGLTDQLAAREGEFQAAVARYEQEEMAQFAALSVLVKDAGFMRKFIKEALLQVGGTLVAAAQPIPDPEFISPAPAQEAAPVAAAAAMEAGPGLPVSQLAPAAEAPAVVAAAPVMLTPQPVVAPMPVAPQPMAPQPMAPQPMAPQPMPAPMLVPAPVPMAAPAPVPQAGSSPPSTPLGSATPVQQGSPPTTPTSSTRMRPIIQKPNQLPNMPVMAPVATTPEPFTPQPMPQSAMAVQQQPAIVPFQPEPATP